MKYVKTIPIYKYSEDDETSETDILSEFHIQFFPLVAPLADWYYIGRYFW
jgi:hypothetical protein